MNIIWDYIQTYLTRRHNRKAWKRILKEYTPEEAAENFIGGGPPPWPHQRKKQMREIGEAIRKHRQSQPLEQKVRNINYSLQYGGTLEESLKRYAITLEEYETEMKKKV